MRGVKSLAAIAAEQRSLSDRAGIVLRLGVAAVVLAIFAAKGWADAVLASIAVLVVSAALSLTVVVLYRRKAAVQALFLPALLVDTASMIVLVNPSMKSAVVGTMVACELARTRAKSACPRWPCTTTTLSSPRAATTLRTSCSAEPVPQTSHT